MSKTIEYDILFCLPGKEFSGDFLMNWSNLLISLCNTGLKCGYINKYNPNLYYVRTQCLGGKNNKPKHQKVFGDDINYKYIVWIDSDNFPTFYDITRLINQDKDIIAGIYHMEKNNLFATVKEKNDSYREKFGTYKFLDNDTINLLKKNILEEFSNENPEELLIKNNMVDKNGVPIEKYLLPVYYTGMGCMIVKQGVFEKIGYPWFLPQEFITENGNKDFMGDDVSFCLLAEKKGFKTYVDIGVQIGHEKKYII